VIAIAQNAVTLGAPAASKRVAFIQEFNMAHTRFVSLVAALALCMGLGFIVPVARADSHARIVRLSYVDGNVQLDRRDGQGFGRAFLNMPVIEGASLRTQDGARAEVEFEDGSAIRLVPDTLLNFTQLGLRDSGAKVTSVEMQEGDAYFDVRRKGDDEFNVSVKGQKIQIPKGAEFRLQADSSQLVLAVYHGDLQVSGAGESAKVSKNQTLTFNLAGNQPYIVSKGTNPDAYYDWNKERDSYRQNYANASVGNYSPYAYGMTDLNYYGNYMNVPGFGLMWRPYYTTPYWQPYMDGAWVFYPGFGYTWVSAYPWGWTPYRYGAWNFVPGYGWCWQPGGWNTFNTIGVVRNAPANFVPPQPPRVNGSPVVIVGHGPTAISPGPGRLGFASPGVAGSGIVNTNRNGIGGMSPGVRRAPPMGMGTGVRSRGTGSSFPGRSSSPSPRGTSRGPVSTPHFMAPAAAPMHSSMGIGSMGMGHAMHSSSTHR
jgi:hypothetical protein